MLLKLTDTGKRQKHLCEGESGLAALMRGASSSIKTLKSTLEEEKKQKAEIEAKYEFLLQRVSQKQPLTLSKENSCSLPLKKSISIGGGGEGGMVGPPL